MFPVLSGKRTGRFTAIHLRGRTRFPSQQPAIPSITAAILKKEDNADWKPNADATAVAYTVPTPWQKATSSDSEIPLKSPEKLRIINLSQSPADDTALKNLAGCVNLESLTAWHTQITDAGLAHLKGLSKLTTLKLDNTRVTDAGLAHLAGLANLEKLYLQQTEISVHDLQERLEEVQSELPGDLGDGSDQAEDPDPSPQVKKKP